MATARKLPSGAWRVQASRKINGILEKKSFTYSDKRTAEAEAAAWQADKQNESIEEITLRQAYERYIVSKENILSPGTVREYYGTARRHLQDIMDIRISKLTTEQIQRSINLCAASTSPKTVRNVHGLLSSVLRMFRPQFTLNTTLPQKKPAELYIPDDNDIKRLMQAVKGTEMEIPVLLAAFGPMRRGEICALNSDDVNGNFITVNKAVVTDKDGKMVIKVPKTVSSYRTIEFPDFVIEKLKGIKGPITNISPGHITRRFNRILSKNNIPHFRFHDLRHYNVSILHAMNIPDKYIMARGGWRTNYTMNNVYNHALKSKQTEYDNKISNHFKNIYD
ncbi:MAG: site-specific integrase [Ruminococcaceae bacterium]|nr:site-specific integrase [Oscillospiraceae bacterium]